MYKKFKDSLFLHKLMLIKKIPFEPAPLPGIFLIKNRWPFFWHNRNMRHHFKYLLSSKNWRKWKDNYKKKLRSRFPKRQSLFPLYVKNFCISRYNYPGNVNLSAKGRKLSNRQRRMLKHAQLLWNLYYKPKYFQYLQVKKGPSVSKTSLKSRDDATSIVEENIFSPDQVTSLSRFLFTFKEFNLSTFKVKGRKSIIQKHFLNLQEALKARTSKKKFLKKSLKSDPLKRVNLLLSSEAKSEEKKKNLSFAAAKNLKDAQPSFLSSPFRSSLTGVATRKAEKGSKKFPKKFRNMYKLKRFFRATSPFVIRTELFFIYRKFLDLHRGIINRYIRKLKRIYYDFKMKRQQLKRKNPLFFFRQLMKRKEKVRRKIFRGHLPQGKERKFSSYLSLQKKEGIKSFLSPHDYSMQSNNVIRVHDFKWKTLTTEQREMVLEKNRQARRKAKEKKFSLNTRVEGEKKKKESAKENFFLEKKRKSFLLKKDPSFKKEKAIVKKEKTIVKKEKTIVKKEKAIVKKKKEKKKKVGDNKKLSSAAILKRVAQNKKLSLELFQKKRQGLLGKAFFIKRDLKKELRKKKKEKLGTKKLSLATILKKVVKKIKLIETVLLKKNLLKRKDFKKLLLREEDIKKILLKKKAEKAISSKKVKKKTLSKKVKREVFFGGYKKGQIFFELFFGRSARIRQYRKKLTYHKKRIYVRKRLIYKKKLMRIRKMLLKKRIFIRKILLKKFLQKKKILRRKIFLKKKILRRKMLLKKKILRRKMLLKRRMHKRRKFLQKKKILRRKMLLKRRMHKRRRLLRRGRFRRFSSLIRKKKKEAYLRAKPTQILRRLRRRMLYFLEDFKVRLFLKFYRFSILQKKKSQARRKKKKVGRAQYSKYLKTFFGSFIKKGIKKYKFYFSVCRKIKKITKKPPLFVLHYALELLRPSLYVKPRRQYKNIVLLPRIITRKFSYQIALRWLLKAISLRSSPISLEDKIITELLDVVRCKSPAFRFKGELYDCLRKNRIFVRRRRGKKVF